MKREEREGQEVKKSDFLVSFLLVRSLVVSVADATIFILVEKIATRGDEEMRTAISLPRSAPGRLPRERVSDGEVLALSTAFSL